MEMQMVEYAGFELTTNNTSVVWVVRLVLCEHQKLKR
jgi:hypothetical protein